MLLNLSMLKKVTLTGDDGCCDAGSTTNKLAFSAATPPEASAGSQPPAP